jgi:addiction module HigA family antidote
MAIKNGPPTIHAGAFLHEALAELDVSKTEFARKIGVSAMRISHIINGQRPVTAELALLFGQSFGQTPQYWLNLQTDYDLKIAQKSIGRRLTSLKRYAQAS